MQAGLDAIVLTDHRRLAPPDVLQSLNKTYAPFRIFGGIELTVSNEDLLVLGVHDIRLELEEWTYPELHSFVRKQRGFIALAHPFRNHAGIELDIEKYTPDAIELYSPHTPVEAEEIILKIASSLKIHTLSNSDAHSTEYLGKYYNTLDRVPAGEKELLEILRAGQFEKTVLAPLKTEMQKQ